MKKLLCFSMVCLVLSGCSGMAPRRVKIIENKISIPGNNPATLVLMNRDLEIIKINNEWYGDDKRYGVIEVNPVKLEITLRYKETKTRNTQIININGQSGHVYYIDYVRAVENVNDMMRIKPASRSAYNFYNVQYGDISNVKRGGKLTGVARRTYRYLGDCYRAINQEGKAKHYYEIAKEMGCAESAKALEEMKGIN